MNTNYQMIKELDNIFVPETKGILNKDEILLIQNTLCIKEMNTLQLHNLRDFVVMYYDLIGVLSEDKTNNENVCDKMSGIVHVIDNELIERTYNRNSKVFEKAIKEAESFDNIRDSVEYER